MAFVTSSYSGAMQFLSWVMIYNLPSMAKKAFKAVGFLCSYYLLYALSYVTINYIMYLYI